MNEEEKLNFKAGMVLAADKKNRNYKCRFVRAGRIKAAGDRLSNIEIVPDALLSAVAAGKFNARAVFIDHAGWFDYPSLRNLAGVTLGAEWDNAEQCVNGIIRLYSEVEPIANLLDEILGDDQPPDVGLSLVFYPVFAPRDNEDEPRRITGIRYVESIDLVFQPAADGRVLEALSTFNVEMLRDSGGLEMSLGTKPVEAEPLNPAPADTGSSVDESHTTGGMGSHAASGMGSQIESSPSEWMNALSASVAGTMIANSGLPAASRERLGAQWYSSPADVESTIAAERIYLAKLTADNVVQIGGRAPRGGHIQVGPAPLEQLSLAAEALFAGTRPAGNVAPLSGIRELYMLLSGDYEMTGMFQPDRVPLAAVTSATMANLVANALNKRVVNMFQEYPRWWERIVTQEDFSTLQAIKWIMVGGVGELPTVEEGGAYSELTWDDKAETASFVKKGGYLGITLETIDKDDTRKVQAAPRALAQAAWLTLAKTISNIFTTASGVGPNVSDGTALFTLAHGNLGSTALSMATWAAARLAMRKQTEVNSAQRLGALTAPRYLLVPPDLEITALQVLASETDYTYTLASGIDAPVNAFTDGDSLTARMQFARERVIVMDLWTDVTDWAAMADPRLYPTIGLGFRYGRTPEIFSVASPTAGLMFSNDTMPIKVRFFFAAGPMDWRGIYKANVSDG